MKFVIYNHPTLGEIKVPVDPPLRENMGGKLGMRAGDYMAGASPITYEIIRSDSDWRSLIFLPDKQYYPTFDTFACTNFSASNSRKLQWKQKTGDEINISEKAMAVLSGTKPGEGNYMVADPDWVRKNGFILNKDWPNDENSDTVQDWFKPVPLDVQKKAIHVNEQYEWVTDFSHQSLQYQLRHAPLTTMITAGSSFHDVCAVYVDGNGIWYLDSYPHDTTDNYLAITTQVPQAVLKIITKPMNTIYFVHITGTSEYGLVMSSPVGKVYVPASTEADLKLRGGTVVPLTPDGKVDYSKAIDVTLPV